MVWLVCTVGLLLGLPAIGRAEEAEPVMSAADTTWMLISTALVLFMTPGLALFYGGMVRKKNVLGTMMHSFFAMALVPVLWMAVGYSLAFGTDIGGVIGGLDYLFLSGISPDDLNGSTYPHLIFIAFQGMFAVITPALVAGAYAERIKFISYALFTGLWLLLVYAPICHWVWGSGGWLFEKGALDFAGGTVVHMSAGFSALAFAIVLGKRRGYGTTNMSPHNLSLTLTGVGMLWFGWFGFNAGSALAASATAGLAFLTTFLCPAAAGLSWSIAEWIRTGKPTALGVSSGIVAGLVAITPAAGFVGPGSAVIMGLIAGVVCYAAVLMKGPLGYDDSLDAFGVHGVGGMLGALLTGVFASWAGWGDPVESLLFHSDMGAALAQFSVQVISVIATAVYSIVVTLVILMVVKAIVGLRVEDQVELEGLDLSQHGEANYHF
ncbi:MAG: ammonium transporter [Nitrospirota bacterium]|jgi:Amt family ammonium transporter